MIKIVNINMGLVLNVYGVLGVFELSQMSSCESRITRHTLRSLELAGTGTVSRSCNSQLMLFTTEQQCELWPVVGFSKTCLRHTSL